MRILVIGGGGREHAVVWRLALSPRVRKIWCAPGNGGIAAQAECVAIDAGDITGLTAFAESVRPDLTVVGPELPLVNGISDAFGDRGWPRSGHGLLEKYSAIANMSSFSKDEATGCMISFLRSPRLKSRSWM